MNSRIYTIILLSFLLFLTGCSMIDKIKKEESKVNILTGAFTDTHGSADVNTSNGSLKNIQESQAQGSDLNFNPQITRLTVLKKLAEIGAGMVSECSYESESYFSVDFNNFNLPTKIVDKRGDIVATCDYQVESKYKLNPICDGLQRCKLIYVSEDNIRGYNPVDKYSIIKN